ncbi:MAG: dihydroneopterin aldolase [Rhodothermales bacterium]|nr:dihydroneopterin aldolase [Rhodothermales bacterium]
MASGSVRLINAVFYAHHGVMEEEHSLGGRFEVDVSMSFDVDAAAASDDLDKTVDYERVYQSVQQIVLGNRFYLIERLAMLIARKILSTHAIVDSVEVTVRKSNPPVGGPCDRAEAVYCLERALEDQV